MNNKSKYSLMIKEFCFMEKKMENLFGKVAAVTGAASGIGLACTKALINQGAYVALIDKDIDKIKSLSVELGECAFPIETDLLDNSSVSDMLSKVLKINGKLDIFYANAGAYVGGDVVDGNPDDWDHMLNLNINATFRAIHSVLPQLISQKAGDIILTSSIAGVIPVVTEPIYTASKHAIQAFTHSLRRQISQYNVRVGAILPGPVATPLLDDWPKDKLEEAQSSGSIIEAKEVADCVIFMLTRPKHVTIRDLVLFPNTLDL